MTQTRTPEASHKDSPSRPSLSSRIAAASRREERGDGPGRRTQSRGAAPAVHTPSTEASARKAPTAPARPKRPAQTTRINPALFRWHAITEENGTILTSAPAKTRYNRSVVAPEPSRSEQIGKWLVIFLISLTIFLIAVATIHNRLGSLLHRTSADVSLNQEVSTWQNPPLEF